MKGNSKMKPRMTLKLILLSVGALFSRSAFSESWVCGAFAENDGIGIVDEGIDLPNATTAATWVLIRSGGSTENRSYSWWFRYRNNDPGAACQTLSTGTASSTTGLYKEQTWLRGDYA